MTNINEPSNSTSIQNENAERHFYRNIFRKFYKTNIILIKKILGENQSEKLYSRSIILIKKILGEKSSISPVNSRKFTQYSFYDLSTIPPSFNFPQYLVLSEFHRIEKGLQYNHICIVPSESNDERCSLLSRDNSTVAQDTTVAQDMQWRIMTMLLPTVYLFDSYSGITLFNSRDEANFFLHSVPKHIFPQDYRVDFPTSTFVTYSPLNEIIYKGNKLPDLHAHPKARVFVDEWLKNNCFGKKVVTITIRECCYFKARNSNLSLYADFIAKLNQDQFAVVILRDTERIFSPVPEEFQKLPLLYFDASHLHMRLALYEKSYMNIGDSGPIVHCFYNKDIRVLMYGLDNEIIFHGENDVIRVGYKIGENLPFMGPLQKIIWERNNETLYGEFLKLSQKIDSMDKIHGNRI
jgi:hypothetical protein